MQKVFYAVLALCLSAAHRCASSPRAARAASTAREV